LSLERSVSVGERLVGAQTRDAAASSTAARRTGAAALVARSSTPQHRQLLHSTRAVRLSITSSRSHWLRLARSAALALTADGLRRASSISPPTNASTRQQSLCALLPAAWRPRASAGCSGLVPRPERSRVHCGAIL
jgi:hypothetical protein